ncbi:MAG: PqqD family protein [Gammaproteobacteria bacterium]|jgi:transcriptional regulator of acetoin/glycerol metabolism|nr:PqqD family protein [Gammaproteobacteria bacterium]
MELQPDYRPTPSPDVRYREVGNEGVVIVQKSGEVLVLNEVGIRVLALADGSRTVDQIVAELLAEYQTEEKILRGDVTRFVTELLEQGILQGPPPA